jgi:hypothetical protein
MAPCCRFAPSLARACRTQFQLPQANLADRGNWLIPKRKVLHAIRCLEAGDGSAFQTRVLCLTLTLPVRDRRDAKVFPYAIGIGPTRATPIAFCLQSAPPAHNPDFESTTRTHPMILRQLPNASKSSCRSSFRRVGQVGTYTSSKYPSSNPKYERKSRSYFA